MCKTISDIIIMLQINVYIVLSQTQGFLVQVLYFLLNFHSLLLTNL